jgi:hypothetical protein
MLIAAACAGVGMTRLAAGSSLITSIASENGFSLGTSTQPGGTANVAILNNVVVNGIGGFAVETSNTHTNTVTDFYYGNASGGAPVALVGQSNISYGGNTFLDYTFTSLGSYGLANDGSILFGMNTTRLNTTAAPSRDALVLQTSGGSPVVLAYDGEQIPGSSAYAGLYYGASGGGTSIATLSGARITQADDAYFFYGGVSSTSGGSQTGEALFRIPAGSASPSIVLKSGDSIAGSGGLHVGTTAGSIYGSMGISQSGS